MKITTITLRYLFSFSFLFVLLISCKKDFREQIRIETATAAIPVYPLDWENIDYMPTPSGTTILVPWANGSVKGFSSDIWYDYKSNEGWVLLYNTFRTTSLPANPWFALYNRYRGLLRIYTYVNISGYTPSDYMTSGLNLNPNVVSTPLLNYIGQDLIDINQNQTAVSKIEPTQIATGTWYASQYEMAYDPQINTYSFEQLGLNWTLKWASITNVILEGTQYGSLNGTISTPASSFNFGGTLIKGAVEATGLTVFQKNIGSDSVNYTDNKLKLPGQVFKAIFEGLTSSLSGTIQNLFSGIFGGNSSNTQQVNLTLNTKIELQGTLTQQGAIIPDPGLGFGIPGLANSQSAAGYIPNFDDPMGVFYLGSKPVINLNTVKTKLNTEDGIYYEYVNYYTLNTSSMSYLWNTTVINNSGNGATVSNLKTDVILIEPDFSSTTNIGGNLEIVGGHTVITGNNGAGITNLVPKVQILSPNVAVRIIFDVVPNNGAPKSTIVKTFLATVVNN